MRSLGVICGALLACVLSCPSEMTAQEVKVLVLDALDGKPQANVEVDYFCVGPPRNSDHKRITTNSEGFAKISNFCNEKQEIDMEVFPPNKKEQCGDDAAINFRNALSSGFLSKPDSAGGIWCPTKVSKTLKAVPGQVILFVKKPTWWQSHIAG